jgi:hypothetical protein
MTNSKKENVTLPAALKGEGKKRVCKVSAVKTTHPLATNVPGYSRIEILDSEDDYPDGNYELDVDGQIFRGVKRDKKYQGFP